MFTIDYCGYQVHNADYDKIYRPHGTSSHLLLLILAPMTFYFPGRDPQKAAPGACILYPSGAFHNYQAEGEFFNSYIHFFCEPQQFDAFTVKTNDIFYPEPVHELHDLIKKIHQESLQPLENSKTMVSLLIHQLLILVERSCRQEHLGREQLHSYYPELLKLRETMLANCEKTWNVDLMCRQLNLGKSQFYHYYEQYFGAAPKQELLAARLRKARYMLSNEAITIKQAAYASGFENICYFNRVFKKHFGCSPGGFRSTASAENNA